MYHGTPTWRRRGACNMATAASAAMQRPGLDQLHWSPTCPQRLRDLICACLSADPQARPTFFSVVETLLSMQKELREAALGGEAAPSSQQPGPSGASSGSGVVSLSSAIPCSTSGVVSAADVAVLRQQAAVSRAWQPASGSSQGSQGSQAALLVSRGVPEPAGPSPASSQAQ